MVEAEDVLEIEFPRDLEKRVDQISRRLLCLPSGELVRSAVGWRASALGRTARDVFGKQLSEPFEDRLAFDERGIGVAKGG